MQRRALALLVALACTAGRTAHAEPDPPAQPHTTVLQEIMLGQSARFRACYEDGHRRDAHLHGHVVTRFVIAANGSVSEIADRGSDLPDPAVIACVEAAIKGLTFPEPKGGELAVVYPLEFEASPPHPAPPSASETQAPAEGAAVSFEPNDPDLWLVGVERQHVVVHEYEFRGGTYYESTGPDARYPVFCKGACRRALPLGTYELGLSKGGRKPASAGRVTLDSPATLHAEYADRRAMRLIGAFGGIAGFIGGMVIVVLASDGAKLDGTALAVGLSTIVVTGGVGLGLAVQQDAARIQIVPLESAPLRTPNEVSSALGSGPHGVALSVRF